MITDDRVLRVVIDHDKDTWNPDKLPISERMLCEHVPGRNDFIRNAIKRLVTEGKIKEIKSNHTKFYCPVYKTRNRTKRTEKEFEKWWKKYDKQRSEFYKHSAVYSGATVGEYTAAKTAWFAVDFTPHIHPFKKVRTWDKEDEY